MNDERLSALVCAQLDDDVAHLDAATISRLNQARQRALATSPTPRWAWFGSAVTACAMLLALSSLWYAPVPTAPVFDELISDGDLELIEELEFYAWLKHAEGPPDELDLREPS